MKEISMEQPCCTTYPKCIHVGLTPAEHKARDIVMQVVSVKMGFDKTGELEVVKWIAQALTEACKEGFEEGRKQGAFECRHAADIARKTSAESMRERAAKVVENEHKNCEPPLCEIANKVRSLPLVEGEKPWTCNGCGKENPLIQHVLECDKPSALRSNDGESRTSGESDLGGKRA